MKSKLNKFLNNLNISFIFISNYYTMLLVKNYILITKGKKSNNKLRIKKQFFWSNLFILKQNNFKS